MLRETSAARTSSRSVTCACAPGANPVKARKAAAETANRIPFLFAMPVKISLAGLWRKHVEAGSLEHHIAGGKVSPMRIAQTCLTIATLPREIKEITSEIAGWAARRKWRWGF